MARSHTEESILTEGSPLYLMLVFLSTTARGGSKTKLGSLDFSGFADNFIK